MAAMAAQRAGAFGGRTCERTRGAVRLRSVARQAASFRLKVYARPRTRLPPSLGPTIHTSAEATMP